MWVFLFVSVVSFVFGQRPSHANQAQAIDWNSINDEATKLLQQYVRIDSSNPPGNTRPAADFLESILARHKIRVVRFASAPRKTILLARLKATTRRPARKAIALVHHMYALP